MRKFLVIVTHIAFFCSYPFAKVFAQEGTTGEVTLQNPLGATTTVTGLVAKIIEFGLGILGALALLMFVYGGIVWMTSQGKQEMVTKGNKTMLWAAIGIVFVFSSYGILTFVFRALGVQ